MEKLRLIRDSWLNAACSHMADARRHGQQHGSVTYFRLGRLFTVNATGRVWRLADLPPDAVVVRCLSGRIEPDNHEDEAARQKVLASVLAELQMLLAKRAHDFLGELFEAMPTFRLPAQAPDDRPPSSDKARG